MLEYFLKIRLWKWHSTEIYYTQINKNPHEIGQQTLSFRTCSLIFVLQIVVFEFRVDGWFKVVQ